MFNKKLEQRVDRLERQFQTICGDLTEIKKELKRPRCFEVGNAVLDDTILGYLGKHIKAIEDYLKIRIAWSWGDDLSVSLPKRPKIKVWWAEKVKSGHNH